MSFYQSTFSQSAEIYFTNSSCSGSIIHFRENSQVPYIITAGHCVPTILNESNPLNDSINHKFNRPKTVIVRKLFDLPPTPVFVHADGIAYATFHGLDIAILSLKESNSELNDLGIHPLQLQTLEPQEKTPVEVINSLTGERAQCSVESKVDFLDYKIWTFQSAFRLSSECRLGPGWSGSPVLDRKTKALLGIISGGNDSGRCDDYCERNTFGERQAFKHHSYFSSMSAIKSCVLQNGAIDTACIRRIVLQNYSNLTFPKAGVRLNSEEPPTNEK